MGGGDTTADPDLAALRFDQLGDPLGHEDPDKDDPLRLWVLVEVDKDDLPALQLPVVEECDASLRVLDQHPGVPCGQGFIPESYLGHVGELVVPVCLDFVVAWQLHALVDELHQSFAAGSVGGDDIDPAPVVGGSHDPDGGTSFTMSHVYDGFQTRGEEVEVGAAIQRSGFGVFWGGHGHNHHTPHVLRVR